MAIVKPDKVRFCIVGTQRTGTTFLRTSLDSHPSILCAGELFLGRAWPIGILQNQEKLFKGGYWQHARHGFFNTFESLLQRKRSIYRFLDGFYDQDGFNAVGFKLMLSQLNSHISLTTYLRQRSIKILHLTRNNVLATLISRARARHTGTYHLSKIETDHANVRSLVYLDEVSLLHRLRQVKDENRALRALFSNSPLYLNISYEDFCSGDSRCRAAIFNFLNVDNYPLSSKLEKIVNGTLKDVIENSDNIYSIVKNSEFANCLDAFC